MRKAIIATVPLFLLVSMFYLLWFNRYSGMHRYELVYMSEAVAEISIDCPFNFFPEISYDPFALYDRRHMRVSVIYANEYLYEVNDDGSSYPIELKDYLKNDQILSSVAEMNGWEFWLSNGGGSLNITVDFKVGRGRWRIGDVSFVEGVVRKIDEG